MGRADAASRRGFIQAFGGFFYVYTSRRRPTLHGNDPDALGRVLAGEFFAARGARVSGASANPHDPCCPNFRVTLGNPILFEEVLIRHPKLRVYLMHAGGPFLQETKAIMAVRRAISRNRRCEVIPLCPAPRVNNLSIR